MSNLINKIYLDPKNPASFGGINRLYSEVKQLNTKVTLKQVENYLQSKDSYNLHKEYKNKRQFQPIFASGIDKQWQADLMSIIDLAKHNDDNKYVLTCIDVFSRYGWAVPIKNKTSQEIIRAFKIILNQGRKPEVLNTDQGKEFLNKEFQQYLKQNNIRFFECVNNTKAALCERFNRTIKNKLWRYFTEKNTHHYLDVLPQLINSYNNSIHRMIGVKPASINTTNEHIILKKQEKYLNSVKPGKKRPKYFTGESVRIIGSKVAFARGFEQRWTNELFYIYKIYDTYLPFMYKLKDIEGEVIKGRFYEYELQRVTEEKGRQYKIEKIIKTRKLKNKPAEVFVKWLGYPDSFNSWIKQSEVKEVS